MNLSKDVATALLQPDEGEPDVVKHWHTETSVGAKSGDFAFVKGTPSWAWDISIGASYDERGMRNDQHDFFRIASKVPLVWKLPETKRNLPPMPTITPPPVQQPSLLAPPMLTISQCDPT